MLNNDAHATLNFDTTTIGIWTFSELMISECQYYHRKNITCLNNDAHVTLNFNTETTGISRFSEFMISECQYYIRKTKSFE